MSDNTTPSPQYVYVTGPRNGGSYAALTLGILSVALIFIPILSSIMAITAIILGANGKAAHKAGLATAGTAALWGLWLGIVNLTVWAALILIWQLGANLN